MGANRERRVVDCWEVTLDALFQISRLSGVVQTTLPFRTALQSKRSQGAATVILGQRLTLSFDSLSHHE